MFTLPPLPRPLPKYDAEEVALGSINYSDLKKPGDLAESYGISARRFPYIATRRAWTQLLPSGGTTAIFIWNGHKIRVTDGILYYDEKPLDNVTPGEKQFAVVNTKLVIWPDKKYIDLQNGKFGELSGEAIIPIAIFKDNSITGTATESVRTGVMPRVWRGFTDNFHPDCYTHGQDTSLVKFDGETWDLPTGQLATIWGAPEPNNPSYATWGESPLKVGDIVIPKKSGNSFDFVWIDKQSSSMFPDRKEYNNEGYYAVITKMEGERTHTETAFTKPSAWKVYFDVYQVNKLGSKFIESFSKNETIKITGSVGGLNDVDKAVISDITEEPNSLIFPKDTFKVPLVFRYLTKPLLQGAWRFNIPKTVPEVGGKNVTFTVTYNNWSREPRVLFFYKSSNSSGKVVIWDPATKTEEDVYDANIGSSTSGVPLSEIKVFADENKNIRISRNIPDLDFICEKDNRLWGCSSKEHTIYASALGLPDQFFTYAGLATDSYAVPVGSDGDFTACRKFGDSAVFFKENEILKIPGGFPAAYALYSYTAEGVKAGCHKSLQVLNNIMYYLGPHGVYAYNGGTPYLISPNFGMKDFTSATSGNDGDTYYLSVLDGDTKHLFAYETRYNIWVREAATKAIDFARNGRELVMLNDNGSVYEITAEKDDINADWLARFVPMYETIRGRKCHSNLIIRAEVPRGSYLKAEIRTDGGVWREAGKIVGNTTDAVSLQLPVNRADKFELKLTGKGPCTVLSILRKFIIQGTR